MISLQGTPLDTVANTPDTDILPPPVKRTHPHRYNQVDDDDFFIKDHTERSQGTVELCVQSCDADRNPLLDFREDPNELLGKPLYFEIMFKEGRLKNQRKAQGLKIRYVS